MTDDNAVTTEIAPDVSTTPTTRARSSGRGMLWFFVFLLIAGLAGASGYFYLKMQQQAAQLVNLQTDVQQTRDAAQIVQQQLESQLEEQFQQTRNELDGQQRELAQRLDALAGRVLAMSNVDREEWKLTEAEHLLRMANQRLLLERSGTNALALAQQVDEILLGLNQAGLQDVRRALAAEVAELRLVGEVDREGTYLRLLALTQQIEKLPVVESLGDEDESWLLEDDENQTGLWASVKRGTNNVLRRFSQHIRVRDHGTDTEALLPPDARQYLKQNLRLMLEQTQTALLREEAEIYQASLTKAQEWLTEYYPLSDEVVALQAELAALQDLSISQTLPDFTQSAALLRQYVERRNARALGVGDAQ